MDYVIIGAGPAGVTAAETVRSIDKTGRIAQIYPKVKVDGHVAEVLAFLTEE